MPSSKAISTGVPKAGVLSKSLEPFLSPTSQKDLADALDETPSADDIKNAWVNENIRDLYRAFAKGRKSTAVQYKGGVDVFDAVEGTRRDLRCVLVSQLLACSLSFALGGGIGGERVVLMHA